MRKMIEFWKHLSHFKTSWLDAENSRCHWFIVDFVFLWITTIWSKLFCLRALKQKWSFLEIMLSKQGPNVKLCKVWWFDVVDFFVNLLVTVLCNQNHFNFWHYVGLKSLLICNFLLKGSFLREGHYRFFLHS